MKLDLAIRSSVVPEFHKILSGNVPRAIHVSGVNLKARYKRDEGQPLVIVREKDQDVRWTKSWTYQKVWIYGHSVLQECYETPMPGSYGMTVCVIFTDALLRVEWCGSEPEMTILDDMPREPIKTPFIDSLVYGPPWSCSGCGVCPMDSDYGCDPRVGRESHAS